MTRRSLGSTLFSALGRLLRLPALRPIVRLFSGAHAALYRRTGGRAQSAKHPTMLLTITGRKSGQPRTVPLVYATDGDRLVIAAAYSGSDTDPVWWRNLRHNPEAVAEVGSERFPVRATLADPAEREALWGRLVGVYPLFAEYQTRTTRQIPVITLRRIEGS